MTDPLGDTTHYRYDANGYLTEMVNALCRVEHSFTYDSYGRTASVTDSQGYTLQYRYDALNRITAIFYPDGTRRQFIWDRLDLATITDRAGHTTTYHYDAGRRLIAQTDALGHTTRYSHYPNSTLKTLTDPNGNVTTWVRDIQGRVIRRTYADGQGTTFTYDSSGRLTSKTDALGQAALYHYTEIAPDGTVAKTLNLWCGERLCVQRKAEGAIIARYFSQGEIQNGRPYLYAKDQVGSIVAMVTKQPPAKADGFK